MPSVVKNSYVVSSEGCPGNGSDAWHFNAFGYRMLGARYAGEALYTLGQHLPYFSFHDYMITLNSNCTYTESTRTLTAKSTGAGLATWNYPHIADWSGSKYLVLKFKDETDPLTELILYKKGSTTASVGYRDTIQGRSTVVVDLHNLDLRGTVMNPAKVAKMVLRCPKGSKIVIDDIFLSDDEQYGEMLTGVRDVNTNKQSFQAPLYSLDGRLAGHRDALKPGIYFSNGKKILVR